MDSNFQALVAINITVVLSHPHCDKRNISLTICGDRIIYGRHTKDSDFQYAVDTNLADEERLADFMIFVTSRSVTLSNSSMIFTVSNGIVAFVYNNECVGGADMRTATTADWVVLVRHIMKYAKLHADNLALSV